MCVVCFNSDNLIESYSFDYLTPNDINEYCISPKIYFLSRQISIFLREMIITMMTTLHLLCPLVSVLICG